MAPSFSPTTTSFGRSAVEDGIITFKTSAAFLSSLGDNLRLNSASPLPSPSTVPQIPQKSWDTSSLLPPRLIKPLSLSQPAPKPHRYTKSCDSALAEHSQKGQHFQKNSVTKPTLKLDSNVDPHLGFNPNHTVYLTTTPSLKQQAVDVIRWTVRYQSFTALRALFTHPLNVTIFALFLFLIERLIRATVRIELNGKWVNVVEPSQLWFSILTTWFSIILMFTAVTFAMVRLPYREASDDIDEKWLGQDEVIIATSADDPSNTDHTKEPRILGALVLSWRLREIPGYGKCRKPRRIGRGVIRGWGVEWRQTRKGVGEQLLREAARVVNARGGDGLAFAEDHAHNQAVLPHFYNGTFERRNRLAKWKLEDIWEEMRSSPRRRF